MQKSECIKKKKKNTKCKRKKQIKSTIVYVKNNYYISNFGNVLNSLQRTCNSISRAMFWNYCYSPRLYWNLKRRQLKNIWVFFVWQSLTFTAHMVGNHWKRCLLQNIGGVPFRVCLSPTSQPTLLPYNKHV